MRSIALLIATLAFLIVPGSGFRLRGSVLPIGSTGSGTEVTVVDTITHVGVPMKVTYTVCLWDDGKDCVIRIDTIRFTGEGVPNDKVKAADIVSWIGQSIVGRELAGGEVGCPARSSIGVSFAASVRRTGWGFIPCDTGMALSVYRCDSAGNVTLIEQIGCLQDGGSGCESTCFGAELQ